MPTGLSTDLFVPSERERLLSAMAELCLERGYRETGVGELTRRAELSRESFEALFEGGREECLLVSASGIAGKTASVASSAAGADSPTDDVLLRVRDVLELMASRPSYVNLTYVVARQSAPPRVQAVYEAGIQVLVLMVERLAGSPSSGSPAVAVRAGLGGAEALLRREILAGRAERLPRFLPDFIYSATVGALGVDRALALARRSRELSGGGEPA